MKAYLLFFLLFFLTFVYLPFGTSYFEGSKVYVAECGIFLLFILQFFSKEGLRLQSFNKKFIWAAFIFLFLSIYHLLFHQSATILFGNTFRLQGTFLFLLLFLFAFLSSSIAIENLKKRIIIFGCIVLQSICTILFIGIGADRPVGTLGEPNALAATVLFLWPFLFFPRPQNRQEWIMAIVGMFFVCLIIFLTGSRSGIIALGVQLVFLYFLRAFYGKLVFPTLIALLFLFASYVTPFLSQADVYENRGEIWVSALHAGFSSPLVGVGFGNTEYALHQSNVTLRNHLPGYSVDSSHNIFLDWFVQGGIVGLGIILFYLGYTLIIFVKRQQLCNILLLLGIVTALSFNPASIVSLLALWWLIGKAINIKN